ncbi:hypothetical protein GA0115241_110712 [Streptomyces sp. DpondAA-D4]|nr:hypothetical protein GA0115241_110712 [Streptomyces sp. DpondAA-D4]
MVCRRLERRAGHRPPYRRPVETARPTTLAGDVAFLASAPAVRPSIRARVGARTGFGHEVGSRPYVTNRGDGGGGRPAAPGRHLLRHRHGDDDRGRGCEHGRLRRLGARASGTLGSASRPASRHCGLRPPSHPPNPEPERRGARGREARPSALCVYPAARRRSAPRIRAALPRTGVDPGDLHPGPRDDRGQSDDTHAEKYHHERGSTGHARPPSPSQQVSSALQRACPPGATPEPPRSSYHQHI